MSDKGFSAVCAAAVKRIVLPQKKIQTYKDASGGVSTTKKRGIYSNLVKLTKKLDPILDGIDPSLKNLWRNPQSFLVLQGPIALVALISLVFSLCTCSYILYRWNKTTGAGYNSYVPDGDLDLPTVQTTQHAADPMSSDADEYPSKIGRKGNGNNGAYESKGGFQPDASRYGPPRE